MKSLLHGLLLLALLAAVGGCGSGGDPPTETPVKKDRLPPKK